MKPLERIRAREAALGMLGVTRSAEPEEVRAAWHKLAFEWHPDRNGGDPTAFLEAQAAYELVHETIGSEEAPQTFQVARRVPTGFRRRPRRPAVTERQIDLTAETVSACRSLFGAGATNSDEAENDGAARSDHVPHAMLCAGRSVTFLVSTPLVDGVNRVALPTGVLTDRRHPAPKVILVRSDGGGQGEMQMLDAVAGQSVPGARRVEIRFGVGDTDD
ncbi:MAG: DnaJ domain-containing protein [Pseudomonadota bacterium]